MMRKNFLVILFCLIVSLGIGAGIFSLVRNQLKLTSEIASTIAHPNPIPGTFSVPSATSTPVLDTQQQIAQLQKEIEDLKNRPPQVIYKTILTPASPSPTPDLKTQQELSQANEQINSLTQQLQTLQAQKSQQGQPAVSDSDLIKSWAASDKVVQVACQDTTLNTWQMGSGVLVSADGKVLTNQHVVQSSLSMAPPDYCLIMFTKDFDPTSGGYRIQYRATVSGFFQDRDAALLKIVDSISKDSNGAVQSSPVNQTFSYFPLLANAIPQIGDAVYVIGFPESAQLNFSVTKGIISNVTSDGSYYGTDAQIDRGNSGGAALNSLGQLIGLPTYKFVSDGDYRGYILNIQTIKL